VVLLRNCPFHLLAGQARDLVCGINLAFSQRLPGWARRTVGHGGAPPEPRALLRGTACREHCPAIAAPT